MTAKSPALTPPTARPPRRACRTRRGSIYAVVMGMSVIVALIGLSTIAVSRINLRSTAVVGESGEAELLALSAVEHATSVVNTNPSWRNDFTHDVEIPSVPLGRGIFTWKLRDEIDGSLSGGGLQPVNVIGYGFVGPARRAFSVRLLPAGPNLLTNGEAEQGLTGWSVNAADCVLESHTTATAAGEVPHGGTRFIWVKSRVNQYAGPQQVMLNKITKGPGKSYYFEAWVKMTKSPEDVWFTLNIKQGGSGPSDVTEKVRASQIAGTEWTKVSATYVPTWTGSETDVFWRVETGQTAQDFLLDDVKVMNGAASTPMKPSLGSWKQVPADDVAAAAASVK